MDLFNFSFSYIDIALVAVIGLLALINRANRNRIDQLERRMEQFQLQATRELNMVSQGSIGIGRRCAAIEKQVKSQGSIAHLTKPKVASNEQAFEAAMKRAKEVTDSPKTVAKKPLQSHSGFSSHAEKALSEWVRANQTA